MSSNPEESGTEMTGQGADSGGGSGAEPSWVGDEGRRSASFSARVFAMLIDLLLIKVFYFCSLLALSVWQWGQFKQVLPLLRGIYFGSAYLMWSLPLFMAAYFLALTSWQGQTPGKMFMGIRVVRTDGEGLGPGLAFLRFIGYGLSLIPLGLGFIRAAFARDARAWHDQLAGTRVVANRSD